MLHRDRILLEKAEYRKNNADKIKKYQSLISKEKAAEYRLNNRKARLDYSKEWKKRNRARVNEYSTKYQASRKISNINYRLAIRLRKRLGTALKNNQKKGSAVDLLGCSVEQLRCHLASKFQPGMTWDNWSLTGWHIDHIRPLSSFDLTDLDQLKQACHYTNLQPLWAKDNLVKGSTNVAA